MKQFVLFLFLLILFSTILQGQDRYICPLEKVDVTKIWHSTPGVIPENTMVSDPIVADIINQTNLDSLVSYVRILSGEDSVWIGNTRVLIQNRGNGGGDLAANYLIQKFESYNLEVFNQIYGGIYSSSGRNVYAVQEGYLNPEKQFIICAHYDAVDVYCADDNASGVATVIEAARILSKYNFKYTLIYALWDEEETGLGGSNYYAYQAALNQDDIQGVLNMDMLAWDGNNDNLLDIHTQNIANSNDLANLMVIVNWLYGLSLNPVIYNPGTWQSDHSSFWNNGYGAILLIEAYYGGDLNPYYHSANDRIDKFNLPYFHNICKLSMGTISTLIEITTDTILASVIPDHGYQAYLSSIQINGANTHFEEDLGTQQVWLSMDQETIAADSFVVNSNTQLNAYFNIQQAAMLGLWDVNVECSIDGIISKSEAFEILPPPAIIVVQPDSIVVDVDQGSTTTKILTIINNGETKLNFSIVGGYSSTNYALQFDGVNDEVKVVNVNGTYSQLTLEAWVILEDNSIIREIIDNADADFQLEIWEGRCIMFDAVGIWSRLVTGIDAMPMNQWVHLAATYDGTIMSIYVDGVLSAQQNYSGSINRPNTIIYIGAEGLYDPWDGIIDEVRIWKISRTQQEIQEFMHKPLTGNEPGLFAYWQFDEGAGTLTLDKSVNGYHGILRNGVKWTTNAALIEPGWFFTNPDSGVCLPQSSINIELLFNATELNSGDYYDTLIINSSDPFNPSVIVPVHLKVEPVVDVENELEIPTVYELWQNYPNPFNPFTTIKYSIPKTSKVKLTFFNLLGEEVMTLVNEEKNAGNYSVELNAASLPSGVYFYQLKAGNYIETKKMLLLK